MWSVFELVLAARGGRGGARHWWFALAGSFMVVNTTSTTGYVALAVAWAVFIWKYVIRLMLDGRVAVRALVAASLVVGAILVAFVLGGHGASLIDVVVLNKMQSGSAVHRLASVVEGVHVFVQSFGLGVGLGSDRALSAGAYILANLGVVGTVLFSYLLWQLYALGGRLGPGGPDDNRSRVWFEAMGWALVVQLLAMLESGAEITGPALWVPWGILAAIVRRDFLMSRSPVVREVPAGLSPLRV